LVSRTGEGPRREARDVPRRRRWASGDDAPGGSAEADAVAAMARRYFFLGVQSWLPLASLVTVPPPLTQALKLAWFDLLPLIVVAALAQGANAITPASANAVMIALVIASSHRQRRKAFGCVALALKKVRGLERWIEPGWVASPW